MRLSAVGGTRSGDRALPHRGPAYEHPPRYLLVGSRDSDLDRGGVRMAAVCGIDWAAEFHDVRIADEHGRVLVEQRFAHDQHGIDALIALLVFHQVARVAIERPEGLLVGRLI